MTESKSRWKGNEEMKSSKDLIENKNAEVTSFHVLITKPTSLSTLIVWNIAKVLEKSPELNIKEAITSTQHRLERAADGEDIQTLLSEDPYERHLACALFAWQQLGHKNAESLCRFVENKRNEEESAAKHPTNNVSQNMTPVSRTTRESTFSKIDSTSSYSSYSMGPVIKLPVKTKLVMRLENTSVRPKVTKTKAFEKGILNKIDKACCLDTECLERLSMMDATTEELRSRAGLLAQREAERVELLERAEAAWKDLEIGYQRRLTLAEEKEEDLAKQVIKAIDERNKYKNECTTLTQQLKEESEIAETVHASLIQIEEELCELACQRLKLREESAKGETLVAEQSCRVAQLDIELQSKEAQARRKMLNLESEVESACALTQEAERAVREELNALRDQIQDVSKQLLEEDSKTQKMKSELEELHQEKKDLLEDLENSKAISDDRVQGKMDELSKKKDQLDKLMVKVMESRCKVPVAVAVEVKRTPSFVAMCQCNPEDKISESCSCTSIRTKMLSSLLTDLFAGLQSEMGGTVTQMPCQLLKCLKDKHNWEHASSLKTNLNNYFSKLLVGELDIAIATSIEYYYTKWLGKSSEATKMTPSSEDVGKEGCLERAIETRVQQLAAQLAQQLFQQRADELTQRSKNVSGADEQPCSCKPKQKQSEACMATPSMPVYWHQALQDVTELRLQIEDLKKDSLKKDDLKTMEENVAKIIQLSSIGCSTDKARSEEEQRRPVKKTPGRVATFGRDVKTSHGKVNNVAGHQTTINTCLVKNTPVVRTRTPVVWDQAVQDVTQLRLQIEDLKKDFIKKEDLKMMENKFAKIINRASGGFASARAEMEYTGNVDEKMNRAQNQWGLNSFVSNKPTTTKRNNYDSSLTKHGNKIKPVFKYGVDKPFNPNKKHDRSYAVNMCLCSTKRKQQVVGNEKNKLETVWKQKVSKDTVSQISSNIRQSKPLNISLLTDEHDSARTIGKEGKDEPCLDHCVCFHKTPSNISIDNILETLTKWKFDLDASMAKCNEKRSISFDLNKSKELSPGQDENASFKSKASLKLEKESQGEPISGKQECLSAQFIENKFDLKQSNASESFKKSRKISTESTNPIAATDSEYIGAVNLDKSNDEICICDNVATNNKNTSYQCITLSKCGCDKYIEAKKLENQLTTRKEIYQMDNNSSVLAKKEQQLNEINILEDISKNKQNTKSQYLEKETNTILNDIGAKKHILENYDSDYQVKFLGVILADTNSPTKNQVSLDNNDKECVNENILTNNPLLRKTCDTNKIKTRKNNYCQNEVYQVTNSYPVPEFSELSYLKKESPSRKISRKGMPKTYVENKDSNEDDENLKKYTKHLDNIQGPSVSRNETGFTKTPSDLGSNNKLFNRVQSQNINEKMNTNFNAYEPVLSNKILNKESDVSRLDNKVNNIFQQKKGILEDVNNAEHSKLANEYIRRIACKQIPCECGVKFDELKKSSNVNVPNQVTNEDVALDVQSLKHFNNIDESCVCCNKLNTDESRDLEDNAFHLLKVYLEKKLDEFKASSCRSFCISQNEEENIFTIILQRVKQLISESTNQITCKCSLEEGKPQGSWNRAYGLLQEYLKIKIKKVQCSCYLTEDKNDSILPDILERICNLIEYDFKRLEDLCVCKNEQIFEVNASNKTKQVNFETEIPEKDTSIDIHSYKDKLSGCVEATDCQVNNSANQGNNTTNNVEQSLASPIPLSLSMEINYHNPLETYHKNIKIKAIAHPRDMFIDGSCNLTKKFNTSDIIKGNILSVSPRSEYSNEGKFTEISETNEGVAQKNENTADEAKENNSHKFSDISDIDSSKEISSKDALHSSMCVTTMVKTSAGAMHEFSIKGSMNKYHHENINLNEAQKANAEVTKNNEPLKSSSNLINNLLLNNSKAEQINSSYFNDTTNQQTSTDTISNKITHSNEKIDLDDRECSHGPYIGHSINNCCCDNSLKACYCPKPLSKAYFLEPSDNVCVQSILRKNAQSDDYLNECKTVFSDKQLVLKQSKEDLKKTHATTNTYKDNTNTDTEYSIIEDSLNSCKCNSDSDFNRHLDSDRLKGSIYFPAPVVEFDESLRNKPTPNNNPVQQFTNGSSKHVCDCELVPICHVKMLVENIETKLANANCTCDSLIPNVCPVHSTMC